MDFQTTISKNGTIQIPESLLRDLGVKPGGKVLISVKQIDMKEDQNSAIEQFFGMGKKKVKNKVDVDSAIAEAVEENDKY